MAAILLAHAALLAWSATRHSPTFDEPFHLAAGVHQWETGRHVLDVGNPPLVGLWAAAPVRLAGYKSDWRRFPNTLGVGIDFFRANGERAMWLMTLARWAVIPFSLLGAIVCFCWARDLFGRGAAWLSLGLWCVCPNVLAHGQLVTGDMPATTVGFAACYAFWLWLRKPAWDLAFFSGLALGATVLTKFVWLPLFGLWPLVWLGWQAASARLAWRGWLKQVMHIATMNILALLVLHAGYEFAGPLPTLRDTHLTRIGLDSGEQTGSLRQWLERNWGHWTVPLPRDYAGGLKEVVENARGSGRVFLNGRWHDQGVWYYYLAALGMKLPLGTLVLFGLATVWAVRAGAASPQDVLALLAVPTGLFGLVMLTTSYNHVRYVLPIIPFAFVWTSQLARGCMAGRMHLRLAIIVGCLLWAAWRTLQCYPHSLSFANEIAGGPKNAYRHLVDSNVDWGQDLLYLRDWAAGHPQARPLRVAYFGLLSPELLGISYPPPHEADATTSHPLPPGWYAVSVNLVQGYGFGMATDDGPTHIPKELLARLREMTPVDRAGYSILIYHVSLEDANRVRLKMGLPELRSEKAAP